VVLALPPVVGLGRDLQVAHDLGELDPLLEQLLGFTQLADDLLGGVPFPLHESHLLPPSGRSGLIACGLVYGGPASIFAPGSWCYRSGQDATMIEAKRGMLGRDCCADRQRGALSSASRWLVDGLRSRRIPLSLRDCLGPGQAYSGTHSLRETTPFVAAVYSAIDAWEGIFCIRR
jgi:hypothetical protein